MTARDIIIALTERQLSDETRLRRVVAFLQRELGRIFGNASVRRRNRRYEIDVAVYEKPLPATGKAYRMPDRQVRAWVKQAADKAHPRLYRRMQVGVEPWRVGAKTHKQFAPVKILIDASQAQHSVAQLEEE